MTFFNSFFVVSCGENPLLIALPVVFSLLCSVRSSCPTASRWLSRLAVGYVHFNKTFAYFSVSISLATHLDPRLSDFTSIFWSWPSHLYHLLLSWEISRITDRVGWPCSLPVKMLASPNQVCGFDSLALAPDACMTPLGGSGLAQVLGFQPVIWLDLDWVLGFDQAGIWGVNQWIWPLSLSFSVSNK